MVAVSHTLCGVSQRFVIHTQSHTQMQQHTQAHR